MRAINPKVQAMIDLIEQGYSVMMIARKLDVSDSTVRDWKVHLTADQNASLVQNGRNQKKRSQHFNPFMKF